MIALIRGDARHIPLADKSVQCVVTSPPYWGLRDYGIGAGQLGLEPTPDLYVEHMVEVFREVKRVIRDDGTLWLNMGDSYANGDKGGYQPSRVKAEDSLQRSSLASDFYGAPHRNWQGLAPKNLIGMPWRLAFALQADGWYLRADIVWSKPNPMPESVRDRPTKAHEYIFLLSKRARYFYDDVAVRAGATGHSWKTDASGRKNGEFGKQRGGEFRRYVPPDRSLRSVWTINSQPFPDAHFATFPEEIPRLAIAAGTSEAGGCADCGAPWRRVVETSHVKRCPGAGDPRRDTRAEGTDRLVGGRGPGGWKGNNILREDSTLGFRAACSCVTDKSPVPQLVLDPFGGSGTVALVAAKMGRRAVSLDLKPEYLQMARERTRGVRAQVPLALDVRGNGHVAEQLALIPTATP